MAGRRRRPGSSDLALHKGDFASALFLGLRLVGFLDSRSQTEIDEAFVLRIRREALSKIDSARRSLISESDRLAFEQAGRDPGCVLGKRGNMEIDKIGQSKYFQIFLQQSKGQAFNELGDQLDRPDKQGYKTSKVLTQAKLASMYGNSTSKANNNPPCKSFLSFRSIGSEDCIIMEKAHSYHSLPKGQGISTFSKVEYEERAHGNSFGTKPTYMEITSPRNENYEITDKQ